MMSLMPKSARTSLARRLLKTGAVTQRRAAHTKVPRRPEEGHSPEGAPGTCGAAGVEVPFFATLPWRGKGSTRGRFSRRSRSLPQGFHSRRWHCWTGVTPSRRPWRSRACQQWNTENTRHGTTATARAFAPTAADKSARGEGVGCGRFVNLFFEAVVSVAGVAEPRRRSAGAFNARRSSYSFSTRSA